jgi:hypothetical protein
MTTSLENFIHFNTDIWNGLGEAGGDKAAEKVSLFH